MGIFSIFSGLEIGAIWCFTFWVILTFHLSFLKFVNLFILDNYVFYHFPKKRDFDLIENKTGRLCEVKMNRVKEKKSINHKTPNKISMGSLLLYVQLLLFSFIVGKIYVFEMIWKRVWRLRKKYKLFSFDILAIFDTFQAVNFNSFFFVYESVRIWTKLIFFSSPRFLKSSLILHRILHHQHFVPSLQFSNIFIQQHQLTLMDNEKLFFKLLNNRW